MSAIRTKTYGPFELISEVSNDGRAFLTLPYADVEGSNILIGVADNYAVFPSQFSPNHLFPGAEITVWGSVQGFETLLKRQCVHMLTGPMAIKFKYEEGWDNLIFRGQNMNGGSVVNLAGIAPFPTQANHFSLTSTVYIFPRGGFTTPGNDSSSSSGLGACRAG